MRLSPVMERLEKVPTELKVQGRQETVKQLDGTDLVELSEQVSFLILKREWMKVWFRNHY